MRKIIALLLTLVLLLSLSACGKSSSKTPLNVMALKGPTGVSMAKLAEDNAKSDSDYNITFAAAPDEVSGKLITGECDIACVPTNLASVLYNKTNGGVKAAAVTTLGVLYIVDTSGEIKSISDLAGKTLGATGQGSNPEYILDKILSENGLDDVTVNYYSEHAELASLVISGEVEIAMLPEPFVTQVLMKSKTNVNVIDLQSEWSRISDTRLAQGVLVVRSETLANNKAAVDRFINDFKASSEYAVNEIADTATICEKLGIIASFKLAEKAIPRCNITFIDKNEMKSCIESFLKTLFDAKPASIGGTMPGDDFYYAG